MIDALDIHVKGIVQGVGFRPFVYRLAKKYLINGWVMNAVDGVHIRAEGDEKLVDEFVLELSENAPAAAQVTEIELREVPIEPFDGFEIRFSDDGDAAETTLVSPDLATCTDCARELFDENDRRFRYPFINCTNCGPRFTIIDELPYDRANTSMRDFEMCDVCAAEYADPADRRFHAQPNACFACGPHRHPEQGAETPQSVISSAEALHPHRHPESTPEAVPSPRHPEEPKATKDLLRCKGEPSQDLGGPYISWSEDAGETVTWGDTLAASDAIFARAVELLAEGGILAVKGLGGFHLVCDANNAEAVARLRERKRREGKPFAVMMASLDDVRCVCEVGVEEAAVLTGAVRPIVLLRKQLGTSFVPGLADCLPELGVMLPYTPVQHLLLHDFAATTQPPGPGNPPMLVMTSGNLHDEPIVTSDAEAYQRLAGVADAFLGNNREIRSRYDDSVVRVIRAGTAGETVQMIRRARGYAPVPINVVVPPTAPSASASTIFAAGPEQKNTFTFLRPSPDGGAEAFVSQHIGDMENAEVFDAWLEAKARYERLFDLAATELACDLHPEYLTSKWARERAALHCPPLPLIEVQHHHAHVAAVMGENALDDAVCGIAFDGTGFGVDGNIWGGEVLLANRQDFERFANFAYVPMPGGASAIKRPLQMAYGVLWEYDLLDHPAAEEALAPLGEAQMQTLETMIDEGINTPVTSSVGRLFDAASALLGVCTQPAYEGEPAILLEAAMGDAPDDGDAVGADAPEGDPYVVDVVKNTATDTSTAHDTSVLLLDAAPVFRGLLDDRAAGVPVAVIARKFHDAFVGAVLQSAQLVQTLYGITTVALSGGVFMNRYLIEHAVAALEEAGFTVALHRELPPNDGCISFGESVVTYAKTEHRNAAPSSS